MNFTDTTVRARKAGLQVRDALRESWMRASALAGQPYLAHVGLHRPQNAGDTLLYVAVRELFDEVLGRQRFSRVPLRRPVRDRDVARWNREAAAVVLGGGGLLIPDTNTNRRSGWQFDISIDQIGSLRRPLFIFAVGYNRFRGQEFSEMFDRHISATVERSSFFSLRNSGSIRALRSHLPPELHERLVFQPCPTTLMGLLRPDLDGQGSGRRTLGVNLAFDRVDLRFPQGTDRVRENLLTFLRHAVAEEWSIKYLRHYPADDAGATWLAEGQVPFETIDLYEESADAVCQAYAGIEVTVGMRGHSQLIPFGLGNRIISLISHDKMKWFLEDIDANEWGVEVHSADLTNRLIAALGAVASDDGQLVREARSRLWQQTLANMDTLRNRLDEAGSS